MSTQVRRPDLRWSKADASTEVAVPALLPFRPGRATSMHAVADVLASPLHPQRSNRRRVRTVRQPSQRLVFRCSVATNAMARFSSGCTARDDTKADDSWSQKHGGRRVINKNGCLCRPRVMRLNKRWNVLCCVRRGILNRYRTAAATEFLNDEMCHDTQLLPTLLK